MADRLDFPRRSVLAVLDDEAAVARAIAGLRALGVRDDDVQRLEGPAAADEMDGTGRRGPLARARRAVQFVLVDQMPTLAWYEAALREGRVVLAVREGRGTGGAGVGGGAIVAALREAGAHFVNGFGRFSTQEFVRWRGPEPRVSELLK